MKRSLCRGILRILGWKIGPEGDNLPKSVICVAPHTSNLDFTLGQLFYGAIGKKAKFFIKAEWFVFPMNIIFKSMGGIPVSRSKSSSITDRMSEEFARCESLHLAIAPEGTRKQVTEWKKGFYYIALKANVPIQVAYIDYEKKEIGFKATFHPTGNADEDIRAIRAMYNGIKGHHEQNFT